ncbi:probable serine/threonine-protein kinase DDB_G0291350 [Ananas comosus]|uniref:non-specific serine/threonine protein kinase n=1 Tax=Ananas comosus TaxID=4615 RepID=A0A6P5GXI0_ANACO|nr:probable serine/threonine-protein kinase DDB_G0291350 [Ananas comosus]
MGCSFSGLNALYGAMSWGGDVWINEDRFRILKQLGEGESASLYIVKEIATAAGEDDGGGGGGIAGKRRRHHHPHHTPSHGDGTYAMKKILIQSPEQLELVKEEIHVSSLFNHPNLLPLLDHSIIAVKGQQGGSWNYEAYVLFPVYLDGTMLDNAIAMHSRDEFFPTYTVLQIFRQLCSGLKHMHSFDPPYAHNDVKPGNILITHTKGQPPLAILTDFGSARPARKQIRSRSEALELQEWAAEHCSAPFRAPELWDCPSHADIDERTDIWSLGCTLYTIMYGMSPFEYAIGESGGSLQLAISNGEIKWPVGPETPYPDSLRLFIIWMLQPQPAMRPYIEDVIFHLDKLFAKLSNKPSHLVSSPTVPL